MITCPVCKASFEAPHQTQSTQKGFEATDSSNISVTQTLTQSATVTHADASQLLHLIHQLRELAGEPGNEDARADLADMARSERLIESGHVGWSDLLLRPIIAVASHVVQWKLEQP